MQQTGWRLFCKRTFDIVAAATGLIVTAPILAASAAAVRIQLGSPVLFTQVRPGFRGRPFKLLKLRTMLDGTGPDGRPLPDAQRLTTFGNLLRSTSIDELPQLFNVLRGELSLVGPRPLLVEYLSRYTREQARRHDVLPGITGWAQVNGRNEHDWPKKLALDIWYVDHWSLMLDARILARTFLRVLRRDGISHAGHTTMPEFLGESGVN